MTQQLLDVPEAAGRSGIDRAPPDRHEPPAPGPIPGWRCLTNAVIRAYGEEGPIDVVALHPDRGVALIGFLAEGEQASPEEACEALRAMLRDEGFEQRFAGELPIIGLPLLRSARAELAATVDRAFAGGPAPTVPPGWIDWVVERLRPALPGAVPPVLALVGPPRDEALPEKPATGIAFVVPERSESLPEKVDGEALLLAPAEAPPHAMSDRRAWLEWGGVLGFAFGLAGALAAGLAMLFRNGRLF